MQTRELRDYCERRGWTVAGEYVDATGGAKDRRPALDKLMADAHRRKFDVVAVWKFDRFARSVSHLLRALDTFRVLGIEFVSLSESLDTATPAWPAECAGEGQEARTAARSRRRSYDCPPARERAVPESDCGEFRSESRNRSRMFKKAAAESGRNRLILLEAVGSVECSTNTCFPNGTLARTEPANPLHGAVGPDAGTDFADLHLD